MKVLGYTVRLILEQLQAEIDMFDGERDRLKTEEIIPLENSPIPDDKDDPTVYLNARLAQEKERSRLLHKSATLRGHAEGLKMAMARLERLAEILEAA